MCGDRDSILHLSIVRVTNLNFPVDVHVSLGELDHRSLVIKLSNQEHFLSIVRILMQKSRNFEIWEIDFAIIKVCLGLFDLVLETPDYIHFLALLQDFDKH